MPMEKLQESPLTTYISQLKTEIANLEKSKEQKNLLAKVSNFFTRVEGELETKQNKLKTAQKLNQLINGTGPAETVVMSCQDFDLLEGGRLNKIYFEVAEDLPAGARAAITREFQRRAEARSAYVP